MLISLSPSVLATAVLEKAKAERAMWACSLAHFPQWSRRSGVDVWYSVPFTSNAGGFYVCKSDERRLPRSFVALGIPIQ